MHAGDTLGIGKDCLNQLAFLAGTNGFLRVSTRVLRNNRADSSGAMT
jgi:hypothetical protein